MSERPIVVVKKKVQAAAHHGGSWKVAYADFVTAMMAFFMVMWIMGMDAQTRSMIQGYFNDPMGFIKNPPKSKNAFSLPGSPATKPGKASRHGDDILDNEKEDMKEIERQIAKELASLPELKELGKSVEISLTDEGLRIELIETAGAVFFESGSAVVRPAARELVGRIGAILTKTRRKVIVEGHTDAEPFGSATYTNWDLSADRAKALRVVLTQAGVGLHQFQGVHGYADTQLKRPDDPTHFSNRRVTLLLPYSRGLDRAKDLPVNALKEDIQGVLKLPEVQIAPNR
jgi:chemotaxis protein MotB